MTRQAVSRKYSLPTTPMVVRRASFWLGNYRHLWDLNDLRTRGWTKSMVTRLLGEEDIWVPTTHYLKKSKRAFHRGRVRAVESTPAFRDMFEASLTRRAVGRDVAAKVLRRSRELDRRGAVTIWHGRLDDAEVHRIAEAARAQQRPAPKKAENTGMTEVVCSLDVTVSPLGEMVEVQVLFSRGLGKDRVYAAGMGGTQAERSTEGTVAQSAAVLLPSVLGSILEHIGGGQRLFPVESWTRSEPPRCWPT